MYPVSYEADYQEGRSRMTTFFRPLLAIPVMIVAMVWAIPVIVTMPIAWLAVVFTGRYPRGLYDYHAKLLRLSGRANGYMYLLTDESPPLSGNDDPAYPVRVGFAEPKAEYSRVKALFRGIIGIPVMLLAYVWSLIVSVMTFIAWFAIMFTGKLSDGLFKPIRQGETYLTRAYAYLLLITEDWPPFAEEESRPAQGQLTGTQQAAATPTAAEEQPAAQ